MKIHPQRFARFLAVCIAILVLLYALFHLPGGEDGDPPTYKAEVLSVTETENEIKEFAPGSLQYEVQLRIDSGSAEGTEATITHRTLNNPAFDIHPQEGDNIIVRDENDTYAIVDYDRLPAMLFLLLGFAALLILFGGMTGLKALLVLLFAVLLIAKGLIAFILFAPSHILLWTILIGAVITLATQLIVNGRNVKSAGAIIGTIGGILVAGLLAVLAIHFTYLTGVSEEQAGMLKALYLKDVDFRELLFSGIVLGALGAVMDVAVSIASAQYEMKLLAPKTKFQTLVSSGLNVGRDVMGTMANTLVLAYIGGALPLILLISAQPDISLLHIMNLNMIATEVVRSLIGSIGLLCAIPITAYATAFLITIRPQRKKREQLHENT
ncbi:YibE/F family protein [Selenomonas sp. oral taxon 138]|uniref:YibE/F family protein n=1 Tax=Selenomonas sp. oral taxon 138 TaxID=712532 RepID=UPI0002A37CE6|nr:YibE/F family protein [Selenomonas sp. oral taxon 138]EKX97068.1 YibE/F-like protein [Selenomonas sp. oral taxon 138 str. F0429]